ncbi:hypothetical protein SEA_DANIELLEIGNACE_88 [Arthrobacter phage DanielleIgnace]|nr:hypothetical protein SEA_DANIELLEIGNACE_88 [Arthrobacter phage DanielleIgnace]
MLFHEEDMIPQTREEFEDRKSDFTQELKDSGIPRTIWAPAWEAAQHYRTDKGLDGFLDRMIKVHGR